jgi:hypothetical protein
MHVCGVKFLPLYHTFYIRNYWSALLSEDIFSRSGKEANNNPGLCFVKGQQSGLCTRSRTGARKQFSSLSLSTTRTTPHCQMLVIHPALYLPLYVLRRDLQGRLRFYKLLNRTVSCELSAISFPRTPACPRTLRVGQRYRSRSFGY